MYQKETRKAILFAKISASTQSIHYPPSPFNCSGVLSSLKHRVSVPLNSLGPETECCVTVKKA